MELRPRARNLGKLRNAKRKLKAQRDSLLLRTFLVWCEKRKSERNEGIVTTFKATEEKFELS